jgi:hypothetical protein
MDSWTDNSVQIHIWIANPLILKHGFAEEVFGFTNEYLVTFFAQGKLFERNFEFPPFNISEKNTVFIDLMGQDCVVAE